MINLLMVLKLEELKCQEEEEWEIMLLLMIMTCNINVMEINLI